MGSCSTGNNTWPSAWPNTAQLNATSPTTKSLFGSYLRRRRRIFSAATTLCLGCQLFQRGAGTRARGKNAQFSTIFFSPRGDKTLSHLPFKNSNRLFHKARKLNNLKRNHLCSTVIFFIFIYRTKWLYVDLIPAYPLNSPLLPVIFNEYVSL